MSYIAIIFLLAIIGTKNVVASYAYSYYHPGLNDLLQMQKIETAIEKIVENNTTKAFTLQNKLEQLEKQPAIITSPKNQRYVTQIKEKLATQLHTSFIKNLDYHSDEAITKFIAKNRGYKNKEYTPENLVTIEASKTIQLTQRYAGIDYKIHQLAYQPLREMAEAYMEQFGVPMVLHSTYRSYAQQVRIYNTCGRVNTCAKPGFSEHQSGLAVDIGGLIENEQRYQWMVENAHNFGFHQTYQGDISMDGYEEEKRHRRFVGKTLATFLQKENRSLAKRYYELHER